jgi:hypothetical protein
MTLGGTIFAATSASAVGTDTTSGFARGNVTAQRGPSGEFGGPFQLKFSAGGTPTNAHGTFTYQEPQGYTVSGQVTCYHQEGNRAVFTGPVTKEANPDNNTGSFVVWVADNDPSLGGRDAFDVAGGANLGPGCATDFPLDRFDNEDVQESLYYVTSGNIVVGDENAQ